MQVQQALKIATAMIMLALIVSIMSIRYKISIVPSAIGCLPIRAAIIDVIERNPGRGQLVSFAVRRAEPYFANGTMFLKIAAGLGGDTVTVDVDKVTITTVEGEQTVYHVNALPMLKYAQLTAEQITGVFKIPKGKVFVLGTLPSSFDSRYWGLINQKDIRGVGYAFL
ncbi:S26 family signal peptidase (plasmid) [Vibrio scophthalmi]|uniref:S26 family signal peptidase n=1 Tax=Vibrio scophthalmi TaxID=45658 RepID=UPI003EBBB3D5